MDFKRTANKNNDFHSPKHICFACNDTGIVQNSDGLLSSLVKGYDMDSDGVLTRGSDLAMVCWCPAAYPVQEDGKVISSGYRHDSGDVHTVEHRGKTVALGVSCPRKVVDDLHSTRKAAWVATQKVMQLKREAAARGEEVEPIPAMIEAREMIDTSSFAQSRVMTPIGAVLAKEFEHMGRKPPEAVQVSNPRDFTPPAGQTPPEPSQAPLTTPTDDHRPEPDPYDF